MMNFATAATARSTKVLLSSAQGTHKTLRVAACCSACGYGGWTGKAAGVRRRWLSYSQGRPAADASFNRYGLPAAAPPTSSQGGPGATKPRRRTAYIALGSNMGGSLGPGGEPGDRIAMIERACNEMDARGIRVRRTSSLWETEPMYVLDQGRFVNGACEVETELEPLALLDQLKDIENSMGRKKVVDKGPRNIDLDILLYGDEKFDHERLKIPHIGIPEREFVLRPLTELIPNKPIDPSRPWKLAQDFLNELTPSTPSLTTLTPLSPNHASLQALSPTRRTQVMGILNVTPDSFSDGGTHASLDAASLLAAVERLATAGATMIDVGGQSTAPGAPEVSLEEEVRRVIPAVKAIHAFNDRPGNPGPPVLISVDTYRAAVAEAAVSAGAHMINDVSGGTLDPDMLATAARLGATLCLMHMRGTPATMNSLSDYGPDDADVVPAVARELLARVAAAEAAGVRRWRLVLDPGLGFAKARAEQNLELIRRLDELRAWPGLEGIPWLLGPSRKRFVGAVTGVSPAAARDSGTAAAVAACVQGGADIVRVHNVGVMSAVVKMADAIWRGVL